MDQVHELQSEFNVNAEAQRAQRQGASLRARRATIATKRRARSDAPYQNNDMKTPRELLLARHRSATPKLDAIRREAVNVAADVNRRKHPLRELTFAATLANAIKLSFLELIWPCRRVWMGLTAVWILILAANISLHEHSPAIIKSGPSSEMMMTLKDQQKILAELLTDYSVPRDADRQKIFSPKPRTENVEAVAV